MLESGVEISCCRKAERELELVAQDNERLFRQVSPAQGCGPVYWGTAGCWLGHCLALLIMMPPRVLLQRAATQSASAPHRMCCGLSTSHLRCLLLPVQLNFVRTRLIGQLPNLDAAVPDIGKLARELQVKWHGWYRCGGMCGLRAVAAGTAHVLNQLVPY